MSKSTLEMASYLEKIDYVPQKVIKNIVRSRSMEIKVANKQGLAKISIILANADIYLMRTLWKLRGQIGKH